MPGSNNPLQGSPHAVSLYKDPTGGLYLDIQFQAIGGSGSAPEVAGSKLARIPVESLSAAPAAETIMHDAMYRWAPDIKHNGTDISEVGQAAGFPRIGFPDAAVTRAKFIYEIPVDWEAVAFRFGWTNESGGSGNINWSFEHRMIDLLAEPNLDTGAVTTTAIALAPGGQFAPVYSLPAALQSIPTPKFAFGNRPVMQCCLVRDGVADAYAGIASLTVATLTRVL